MTPNTELTGPLWLENKRQYEKLGCPRESWEEVKIKLYSENLDVSAGGWRKEGAISQERTKGFFLGVVTFKLGC